MILTIPQEIDDISAVRPHLVILGAGASSAAMPKGDKNRKKLPLMKDLVEVIQLQNILNDAGVNWKSRDFEEVYAELTSNELLKPYSIKIEETIYQYFDSLELPDSPTMYDHLVLGLRSKDYIATFNWDPLLVQALRRNQHIKSLPKALYLHGNVALSYCSSCRIHHLKSSDCTNCKNHTKPMKLLYPVTQKEYSKHPEIWPMWQAVKRALENAYIVTVFGYSAPKSDIEAINLFKDSWGQPKERVLEQFELIVKKEENMRKKVDKINYREGKKKRWDSFINSHHYEIQVDFYKSIIAQHPRRSVEVKWKEINETCFADTLPFPKSLSFEELFNFLSPRIAAEKL